MIGVISIVQVALVIGVWTSILAGQDRTTEHNVRIQELARRVENIEAQKVEVRLVKLEQAFEQQNGRDIGQLVLLSGLSLKEIVMLVAGRRKRRTREDE